METLLLTIHVIACVSLIILVLLQSGHEGMGVIFGGGSSSSFFGSSGAGGLLTKLTVTMAVIFFVTSLGFTFLQSHKNAATPGSVILDQSAPSKPGIPGSSLPTPDKSASSTKASPEKGVKTSGQGTQNTVPTPSTKQ